MTFMMKWTVPCETRDKIIARFKQSGGPVPPGVKLVGRWHGIEGGVAIIETDDQVALTKHCLEWTDLMPMQVSPVLDDAGIAKAV